MGKRITFSISAVSIGLLLALGLIEGTMRFVGWQLTQGSDSTNRSVEPSSPHDENEFRIVCLGESTTAPLYVADQNIAWPGALEQKLNSLRLGRRFRTITIAKHGTSTPFLLRDLERDIDMIDPHLVISMMGINDLSSLEYFQRDDWFGNLRTMKLAKWLMQSLRQRFQPELSPTESHDIYKAMLLIPPGSIRNTTHEMPKIQSHADLSLFRENVEKYVQSLPRRQRYFVYEIATIGIFNLHSQDSVEHKLAPALSRELQNTAIEMNRKWLSHYPADMFAVRFFIYTTIHRDDLQTERITYIHQALGHGGVLDDALVSLIGNYRDSKIQGEIQRFGIQSNRTETPLSSTRTNYLRLARMLKERKIHYMAMQYPMANTSGLRAIFSSQPPKMISYHDLISEPDIDNPVTPEFLHVLFVSNENFRDTVTHENEAEYFTDMFATNKQLRFGHTTKKGHDLIADNIIQVFRKNWDKLKTNPSATQ